MASIHKRPVRGGSAFDVRYRDTNNRPRERTFRTAADAAAFKKQVTAAVVVGDFVDPKLQQLPVSHWAAEWTRTLGGLKVKTRLGYESTLKLHVAPHLGTRAAGSLTKAEIRQFLAGIPTYPTRVATRKVLRLVLQAAVEAGALRVNPVDGIRLAGGYTRERMLFLNMDEVIRLSAHMGRADYGLLVRFAALTGLRAGEIGALRIKRVDTAGCVVEVAESVSEVERHGLLYGGTKTNRTRPVPLPTTLAEEMADHIALLDGEPEGFVFRSPEGGPLRRSNFYGRYFKPAVVAAGLPPELRFHDLRHSFAAQLLSDGAPLLAVKERMGHSSITVTVDRYGHLIKEVDDQVTKSLDASYRAALTS